MTGARSPARSRSPVCLSVSRALSLATTTSPVGVMHSCNWSTRSRSRSTSGGSLVVVEAVVVVAVPVGPIHPTPTTTPNNHATTMWVSVLPRAVRLVCFCCFWLSNHQLFRQLMDDDPFRANGTIEDYQRAQDELFGENEYSRHEVPGGYVITGPRSFGEIPYSAGSPISLISILLSASLSRTNTGRF